MSLDSIGEIDDRASEEQAAEVYGTGFTAEFLARNGARGGMRGRGTRLFLTRS